MPSLPKERLLESVTDYAQVEKIIKDSLPSSIYACMVPKVTTDFTLTGYIVSRPIPEQDRQQAIEILNEAMLPCSKDIAVQAMFALKVRTASTAAEREIAEERIGLYLADIIAYPKDIVIAACRAIADESRWFPAWADLRKGLERRLRERKCRLEALNGD